MKRTKPCIRVILVTTLASGFLVGWPAAARAEDPFASAPAMAPASGEVVRAVFARSIAEREPQDVVSSIDTDTQQIFFFTELVGMEGRTVRHRWEHDGQTEAEVAIQVGTSRWRAYSSKRLMPGQTGSWTVSVVDESGNVLRTETLSMALANLEPSTATPPAAPAE